jgi:hypothetical protein
LIHNTSTTSYAEMHLSASREYRVGTGGSGTGADAKDNWYVYDSTAAAHRFTINPSGDVGINDYSPSYKLDVNGTGRFVGALTLDAGLTLTGNTTMTGDLTVGGTVTAQEFHAEFVSSSIIYESGSTKFGDDVTDFHDFTGSVDILHANNGGMTLKDSTGNGLMLGEYAYTTSDIYTGITHTSMSAGADDYMMISKGEDTYISAANTKSVYIRGGGNYTPNQIQVADGSTITFTTTIGYFTGDVGIGTATPSSKLHVGGTGASFGAAPITSNATIETDMMSDDLYHSVLQLISNRQSLTTGASSNAYLGFTTIDDSNNQGVDDAGRIAIVNETPGNRQSRTALTFWTNYDAQTPLTRATPATEKMRISSAGYVGIGTTNPGALLDIEGTDGYLATFVSTTDFASTILADDDTTIYFIAKDAHASIGGNSTFHADNLNINTSNGYVGIGTTNATSILELNTDGSNLVIADSQAYSVVNLGGRITFKYIYNSSGTYTTGPNIAMEKESEADGNYGAALKFTTREHGSSASEKMRITGAGNVGIGSLSPTQKLIAFDDVNGEVAIKIYNANTGTAAYATLVIDTADAGAGYILVGDPGGSNAAANNRLEVLATSANDGVSLSADSATGTIQFYTTGRALANERMRISADGKVGIGTNAPKEQLDISDTTGGTLLLKRYDGTTTTNELLGQIKFDTTD